MKINPLDLLLNTNLKINKKFYFISGNETTLIQKISDLILEKHTINNEFSLSKIDTIDNFKSDVGLFDNKKIYLGKGCKGLNEENLNKIRESDSVFVFVQENSSKIKQIKNIFLKDKDSYLVDCYELDKSSKIKILNSFLNQNKIKIENDTYWFLIDRLDNRYTFLQNNLNKILSLLPNEITINNVKKTLTIDSVGKEMLFFNIFNKNSKIIEMYREKILSTSDVTELYYYCRSFCQNIIDNDNEFEFTQKIPVYLFKQKKFLIELFKKYNFQKKKKLVSLLLQTEIYLRKENQLSLITGLRFLLSLKKITTS